MKNTRLVRFSRYHNEDDALVASKSLGTPEGVDYMAQLIAELAEGSLDKAEDIRLVHAELSPQIPGLDEDIYILYARVPAKADEEPSELAGRIQNAYDEGAVAGFFQIIE